MVDYRDKILELVEDGLIDSDTALREVLMFMSMDDNRRVFEGMLGYMGVEVEPDRKLQVELWTEVSEK